MNNKQLTDEQIRKVKDNNLIENVIGQHVDLKQSGTNLKGLCPFHEEKTPSFVVSPSRQMYKCFGCGAGGDVIEFVEKINECSFVDAVEKLGEKAEVKNNYQKPKAEVKPTWQPLPFVPKGIDLPNFDHYKHGEASQIYHYKNAEGQTIGFVCRYDIGQGKKEILPLCYAELEGRKEWRFMGFGKPRPLYNLDAISSYPDMPIMLVEGEKTANAANKFFGDEFICTTWIGGVNGVRNADFTPLHGRTVLVCPDNDAQGRAAMDGIMRLLNEMECEIFYFNAPSNLPDKWDIADFKGNYDEARELVQGNSVNYSDYLSSKDEPNNAPNTDVSKTEKVVTKTERLEFLKALEFDPNEEYIEPDYIVKIHTTDRITNIGGEGCLITFTGSKKSGKSFLASQMAVSALTSTIRVGVEFDLRGKNIVYVDTEQPKFHFLKSQHFIKKQVESMGCSMDKYKAFQLRALSVDERLAAVKDIAKLYPNLGLFIIDGTVDIMHDYNDNKEAKAIMNEIMKISENTGAVVAHVLHLAKSTGKTRGHVGTESDNKSDCTIKCFKDEDTNIFTVKCQDLRGNMGFPSYEFMRDEQGFPTLINSDIDQQPPTYLRQSNYEEFKQEVRNNSDNYEDIPF